MVKSTNETSAAGVPTAARSRQPEEGMHGGLAAVPAPPVVFPVPLARLGGVLTAGTLFAYGGVFLWLCVRHVCYPGFLEPMEGDVLQHVERLANGQPAYPAPTGEFIPLPYMPLYYFAAAPLYCIFGDSFVGPRLLSSVCALVTGGLVGWMGWRETRSRSLAMLAAALYFASYRIMDAWLTCALPDAMYVMWLVLGFCFFAYGRSWRHDAAWLLCFTLAFWTKQHGALFFGGVVLYALCRGRSHERVSSLPRWCLLAGIVSGGPVAYFGLAPWLGENFIFHTLTEPGNWERSWWLSARRTAFVLVDFLPFASLLSGYYLFRAVRLRPLDVPPLAWFAACALVATAVTMSVSGSSNNHFIPLVAMLCVTSVAGLLRVLRDSRTSDWTASLILCAAATSGMTLLALWRFGYHPIPRFVPLVAAAVLLSWLAVLACRLQVAGRRVALAALLAVGQLATVFFWPPRYLEFPGYREGILRLQAELASLDGPVIWLPYGNAPAALTGFKIARAPSGVTLEDIQRQAADPAHPAQLTLAPFRERVLRAQRLYVLSSGPVAEMLVWNELPVEWQLVRDYGRDLSSVRQVTRHWFGGGEFPRYLYRKGDPVTTRDADAATANGSGKAGASE